MAVTHTQRTELFSTLVDVMGQENAETLFEQLPPSGWDNMATKDDIAGAELRIQAALATAVADSHAKLADTNVKLADTNVKLAETTAALQVAMRTGFAEAAKERAELTKGLAEVIKMQARQLYVIVSAIAAATVSIWIALFTRALG